MRRARLDGQRIGRAPLVLDSAAIQQDRQHGRHGVLTNLRRRVQLMLVSSNAASLRL